MADKTFVTVKPPLRAVDNLDGTFSVSILDVNSAALLAAVQALRVVSTLDSVEAAVAALAVANIDSSTETAVAVQVTTTEILAANALRGDVDLVNDGDDPIYLARGNDAVLGSGIRLNGNGGSYHIGRNNLFLGAINGIAESVTNLTVSEGVTA